MKAICRKLSSYEINCVSLVFSLSPKTPSLPSPLRPLCSRKMSFWIREYERERMLLVFLMEKQSENVDKINGFTLCRTRYIKFDTLMENTWLNGLTVQLHDGFRFTCHIYIQVQNCIKKKKRKKEKIFLLDATVAEKHKYIVD